MPVVSAVVSILFATSMQVGAPEHADMAQPFQSDVVSVTTRDCPAWMHALGWC